MHLRTSWFFLSGWLLVVASLVPSGLARAARAAGEPNLLVIMTDEHNFRTLGCYRELMSAEQAFVWGKDVKVETPHIDWLAKHGAIADRFYATSPVCTPSRAAFVSGLYPHNTGAYMNNLPMSDRVVTFAEVLRRHGLRRQVASRQRCAARLAATAQIRLR